MARCFKDGRQQRGIGLHLRGGYQRRPVVCRNGHQKTRGFGRRRATRREVLRKMNAIGAHSAGQIEIPPDDQLNMRGAAARGEGKGEILPLRHPVVAQEHGVAGAQLCDRLQWIGQTLFVGNQNKRRQRRAAVVAQIEAVRVLC